MRVIDPKRIQGASSEVVRDINRRIVLNLIRTRQPISRADLARLCGLQRSTISLIVEQLINESWVIEGPTGRLPRGRRPTFLRLNDDRVIVGIDIRPEQTTVALADANGKFTSREVITTPSDPKTDPRAITYDEEGYPHGLTGSKLTKEEYKFSQTKALTGFDSDSGMTMLRIGSMNLMLHGIAAPNFRYTDTLSKAFAEERVYDVVLANPPFKGAIDSADVNPTLPVKCKKTEILFLHLFLRLLENGGRGAVIVPDGVLFGSSNAHVDVRKKIIEENRLDGVVSMPSGVFRPYAGVSTAVLLFTKGGTTERIWFYDMEHDGYSLDDKRQKVAENDIPDVLDCWNHRRDAKLQQKRAQRLTDLQKQIAPLKKDRLEHHAIIHRLKFEEVVSKTADDARAAREKAEAELAELQSRITPLQTEINQLTRQFWVTKDQVKAHKYRSE